MLACASRPSQDVRSSRLTVMVRVGVDVRAGGASVAVGADVRVGVGGMRSWS